MNKHELETLLGEIAQHLDEEEAYQDMMKVDVHTDDTVSGHAYHLLQRAYKLLKAVERGL